MIKRKSKHFTNVVLPTSLVREIKEITTSRVQLHRCFQIIDLILKSEKDAIPASYWISALGSKYYKYANLLVDYNIIYNSGVYFEGKALEWFINPIYWQDKDVDVVKYSYFRRYKNRGQEIAALSQREAFINDFKKLSIPFPKLYAKRDEIIDDMSISDYPAFEDVKWGGCRRVQEIDLDGFVEDRFITWKDAAVTADATNRVLVEKNKRFYIIDAEMLMVMAKEDAYKSYTASIENLKSEDTLYANRNETNNRLDTNFTNMKSELYGIIKEENNLAELDLANSQPAILSHILKENDIIDGNFAKAAEKGKLYDEMAKESNITREEAKVMMFQILFRRHTKSNRYTRMFEKKYPEVAKFIFDYKRTFGDNQFCIMLQEWESELFIDNILKEVHGRGILAFTKHDSITVPQDKIDEVEAYVNGLFKKIGFKVEIKRELKAA
ncbi:hypothetical protein [Galbibacter pacificus]|uniref:Uncharacterized protein n=1 Tax=Galbibacter pacificus TaxID=2996052 RepID=A0ABT6FQG0_9FLAO|nr:hypothetical protein [Galbibacter pacificus]MDG3582033.1 hypothetical protein [Galbibacter pacificus]MDG3585493.1 hypothetical protein [Galbibacter pacificus]